jgi:hypothetical protein
VGVVVYLVLLGYPFRTPYLPLPPGNDCSITVWTTLKPSRELVAKALLFLAQEPKAAGLTIDLMDGDNDLASELHRVVEEQTDAWTG